MDASLTKNGPRFVLGLERRLEHPPEKVWRAFTERELLKQWWPADVIGEWRVGAALEFVFQHGEGEGLPEEELRGEVLTVDPPRLLEFSWGQHLFRCELIPAGDGCTLRFSESFEDASWGARNAAGWELCLGNLVSILEGVALAKFVMDVWRERFEHYVARFQPQFGPQQGPPENHPGVEAQKEADA